MQKLTITGVMMPRGMMMMPGPGMMMSRRVAGRVMSAVVAPVRSAGVVAESTASITKAHFWLFLGILVDRCCGDFERLKTKANPFYIQRGSTWLSIEGRRVMSFYNRRS